MGRTLGVHSQKGQKGIFLRLLVLYRARLQAVTVAHKKKAACTGEESDKRKHLETG